MDLWDREPDTPPDSYVDRNGRALKHGASHPLPGDSWLGIWDVVLRIPDCPGPGQDGSWPGVFRVFREGDRHIVKWLHTNLAENLEIVTINESKFKALNHDPWENEWELTLSAGGGKAEGYMQQQAPARGPDDPCGHRGAMVATKRR